MRSESLFALFDKIDALREFSPAALSPLLGVELKLADPSAIPQVYTASNNEWPHVELRVVKGKSNRGLVILDLKSPIPLDEVTRKYGSKFQVIPPNPSAPALSSAGYEYRARHGVIRFLFPDLDHPQVRGVVFDRF